METWAVVVGFLVVVAAAGALVVPAAVSRRRVGLLPGAFPCRLRSPGSRHRGVWPRGRCRGLWVHEVLLVHHGLARRGLLPLAVRLPEGPMRVAGRWGNRWGPAAVHLELRLDDGTVVDVVSPTAYREALAGPYLVAAVGQLAGDNAER